MVVQGILLVGGFLLSLRIRFRERDEGHRIEGKLTAHRRLPQSSHKFKTKRPEGLEDVACNPEECEVLLAGQHLGLQDVQDAVNFGFIGLSFAG